METHFTIHEVSTETGLSAHTLRYYERIGLIVHVTRDTGGRRRYTRADLEWLRFLMRLRDTGMPIATMLHYAELRRQGESTHAERGDLMARHLASLQARIAHLQELATYVAAKVEWYQDPARISITGLEQEKHHADRKPALHQRSRQTR